MRSLSANEVIGYFWIAVVVVFIALAAWRVNDFLHKDEVCALQSSFTCEQKRIYLENGETAVTIMARNNIGRWIQITGFSCSSETPDPSLGYPRSGFQDVKINVVPGADFEVSGKCQMKAGEKADGHFSGLVYFRCEYKDEPYIPGSFVVVGNVRGSVMN